MKTSRKQYVVCSMGIVYMLFFLTTYYLLPTTAIAQAKPADPTPYILLAPIPLQGPESGVTTVTTAKDYIPGLIKLAIALAGVLAVLRIMWGGFQYISTDAISGKSEAKGIISNALWGLLLAMTAWLILYTLNPKLVEINLDITPLKTTPGELPGMGGTGGSTPTRVVGCQGDCKYSYTSSGEIIRYRDCNSCSPIGNGLQLKYPTVDGKPAQMNTEMLSRLRAVGSSLNNLPEFRVTETWPPTSNHSNQGQYDGTSVDVSLYVNTAPNVSRFIREANRNGLDVVYEVKSVSDIPPNLNLERCSGVGDRNCLLVLPRITGSHFSIFKR